VLRDAVNKSLDVKPNHADAAPALDALHGKVDAQRDRADAALDNATPPQPAPVTPVSTQSNAEAANATATLQR